MNEDPDSCALPALDEARGAAELLVAYAIDQEHRLSDLLGLLEPDANAILVLRELHGVAREQRRVAGDLLTRLGGARERVAPEPPTILVVDDDRDGREILAAMLEVLGFSTVTASNGLEGLLAAHSVRPDLVLMDVAMPVLNGLEAARLLKANASTQDLKVIAHTATPDLFDSPSALFVDVLRKPASQDAILASIQRFVPSCSPR